MQYLQAILVFLVILPMVVSRECYQCRSSISLTDCDRNRIRVRCLAAQRCVTAKVYATSGIRDEGYARGCAATCSASGIPLCKDPKYKCEVNCCSSDYCNKSNPPISPTSENKRKENRFYSAASALLPTSASGFLLMGTGVMLVSRFLS